jgi:hypothetical protein
MPKVGTKNTLIYFSIKKSIPKGELLGIDFFIEESLNY